ncbi:hypothetical protein NT6N_29550 [Oceaniferula spumae]|uniref:Gingipain domain-containing protein n=1 Tax=Oceaniferula spumae TaxID=2979115 RepID=A0AAT9FPG6_9BACT
MNLKKSILTCVLLTIVALFECKAAGSYAIVVREKVATDPEWKKVVEELRAKHAGAVTVHWENDLTDALPKLQEIHPSFTCFVTPCTESGPGFVAQVHRLTRQYDDDIYTDTRWGIVTGYDAASALKLVKFDQPITVKKVSSGTEFAMEMVEQGIWYDELVKNKTVSKQTAEGEVVEGECPTDTTQLIADTLSDWKSDLFITSGHGFKQGWQIGFRYKNGHFQSKDGQLFGKDTTGKIFPINSDHPRVYLPIGNCSIGCVENENAYTIAMMKSAGVKGMIGYTVPTWYGYAGWGMLDYFVEQPGRYTLNEAFLANQLALVHRLETSFPGAMKMSPNPGKTSRAHSPLTPAGKALGVKQSDAPGLLHDRDVLAYYGDPALQAIMSSRTPAYDQKLTKDGDVYTLTVTGKRGEKSFAPVNTNGSQRGGRPIIQLLPRRVGQVEILDGKEHAPVVADDFILIPNPGVGEGMTLRFRAKAIERP